jgi:hypothetical protein
MNAQRRCRQCTLKNVSTPVIHVPCWIARTLVVVAIGFFLCFRLCCPGDGCSLKPAGAQLGAADGQHA